MTKKWLKPNYIINLLLKSLLLDSYLNNILKNNNKIKEPNKSKFCGKGGREITLPSWKILSYTCVLYIIIIIFRDKKYNTYYIMIRSMIVYSIPISN